MLAAPIFFDLSKQVGATGIDLGQQGGPLAHRLPGLLLPRPALLQLRRRVPLIVLRQPQVAGEVRWPPRRPRPALILLLPVLLLLGVTIPIFLSCSGHRVTTIPARQGHPRRGPQERRRHPQALA
jgi:hypothetical protein